jgi:hypothetical protein
MLKFAVASASVLSVANALAASEGVTSVQYNGGAAVLAAATQNVPDAITVNTMTVNADHTLGTYVGLFGVNPPTDHTEQATGGPLTKIACVGTAICTLPLYQNSDVFSPVPSGTYYVFAVNGGDTDHTAATGAEFVTVTIDPYISAWGSTLQQATNPSVERGDDLLITWSGLAVDDIIEYRLITTVAGIDCPPDFHKITAAEASLGGGTISLKTAQSETLVGFAEVGAHSIFLVPALTVTYADTSNCGTLAAAASATLGVARTLTITESDAIAVTSSKVDVEAGSDLTVTYTLATDTTTGTYVGLWFETTAPISHVVDAAGGPLSVSLLPVGIAGAGVISLKVPSGVALGNYIVNIYNSNDAYVVNRGFTPLAETSITDFAVHGPHDLSVATVHNTDINVVYTPTSLPSGVPSGQPSVAPTVSPIGPTGQPTGIPTSSPSFVEETWGEYVWTEKRHRKAGMCENQCSGHGTCEVNGNCQCFTGLDGEDEWTGPDCSSRTCPFDFAWVGASINSNNLHPWAECSNKGLCDRGSGECQCFTGYEGAACQRTVCPDNCNDQGTCWPEKHLASKAGRVYEAPWDAMKHVGCLCDAGYRGPACDQQECPSGADPLSGYGNEAGRDCSGRGICDYSNGICACFTGFFGTRCQHQTTVM